MATVDYPRIAEPMLVVRGTEQRTKEQADHDLRYLLAVAFLNGNVMPAQFAAYRITRPDVQSLMTKVFAGRRADGS